MKKKLLIVLIMILCLSACGKKGNEEEKASYELGGNTYYNSVDNYGHEDHSKLWFGKDGSFVFTDSYTDGYNELSGKWTLNENVVTLDVEDGGKESVSKLILEVLDKDTLKLRTSLSGSKSDDLFSTIEVKGSSVEPKKEETTPAAPEETKTDTKEEEVKPEETKKEEEKKDDTKKEDTAVTPSEKIPCTGITSLYRNYWSYENEKDWDLEIRPVPENTTDKITFKSSDEKVVKIDEKGRATAVAPGKATIEAVCGDKKLTVNYEVRAKGVPATAASYKAKFSDVNDAFQPTVSFDPTGTFVFTENVYAGMAKIKGTYKVEDGRYYCTVTDNSSMQGFAGQDVKEIVFKVVDEKTLKLKTDLCMSGSGRLFYLEG